MTHLKRLSIKANILVTICQCLRCEATYQSPVSPQSWLGLSGSPWRHLGLSHTPTNQAILWDNNGTCLWNHAHTLHVIIFICIKYSISIIHYITCSIYNIIYSACIKYVLVALQDNGMEFYHLIYLSFSFRGKVVLLRHVHKFNEIAGQWGTHMT